MRVAAQLIDALSDEYVWEAKYDEELTAANVFQIQSQLTSRIAEELNMRLLPGVQERINFQPTDNLVAWDLASRGRILLDKTRSQDDLESATMLFQQSIDEDPEYALAWSGLARSVMELVSWHYWEEDQLNKAIAAAKNAIELDPNLSEGFAALSNLLRLQRRFDESVTAIERALELSPGSADTRSVYSDLLRDMGELRSAVDEARKSVDLGPNAMRNRDILLLDQRGTGNSAPLECEIGDELIAGRFSIEQTVAWFSLGSSVGSNARLSSFMSLIVSQRS